MKMPFCNMEEFPDAKNEYVCWVDIMGTRNKMSESVRTSAIFIYKLHAAILKNLMPEVKAYPLMDGVYLTSPNQKNIKHLLRNVFIEIANEFCSTNNPQFQFFIKGALAYGPIVHGVDVPNTVNDIFGQYTEYKNSILMGLPMIQAYNHEKEVPPFGIFIDESARAFSPEGCNPLHYKWWKWYLEEYDGLSHFMSWSENETRNLVNKGNTFYDYAKGHSDELNYGLDRIEVHKNLFNEYLK
jgi:hypothetical protein